MMGVRNNTGCLIQNTVSTAREVDRRNNRLRHREPHDFMLLVEMLDFVLVSARIMLSSFKPVMEIDVEEVISWTQSDVVALQVLTNCPQGYSYW